MSGSDSELRTSGPNPESVLPTGALLMMKAGSMFDKLFFSAQPSPVMKVCGLLAPFHRRENRGSGRLGNSTNVREWLGP